jgi:hypothetical protein
MLEFITHTLGICGEHHFSIFSIITNELNILNQITHIKQWLQSNF